MVAAKQISKVREMDVAAVEGNKTLAATVDRRTVERCKETIEKIGVVHTPIIGATKDGNRLLLSGQSELTALRELGVMKMDAIEIDITGDCGAKAKLSLLLASLRDRPGALCEGLLLQEAVGAGVPRAEIQAMLGKSASWVSNRLSLVTRLDGSVYDMVKSGLLEPRSAQEVARLPAEAQFAFAEMAVREGLPKSAVESLVAGYNDESCPDAVKAQILGDPRSALRRMADKRRAVNADGGLKRAAPPADAEGCVKMAKSLMGMLSRTLFSLSEHGAAEQKRALKELEDGLLALLAMVRGLFSPGKMEVGRIVG